MKFSTLHCDYYQKSWTQSEFEEQCGILGSSLGYTAVDDEGFVRLNVIEKTIQVVKGFFGFTDYSEEHRVNAAILKLLYYGEVKGFLDRITITHLRDSSPSKTDFHLFMLFETIIKHRNHYSNEGMDRAKHLKNLRGIIVEYYTLHKAFLRPCYWSRMFTSVPKDVQHSQFGETPLKLSKQLPKQTQNYTEEALVYLKKAFEVQNDSPDFQHKLAEQLKNLEKTTLNPSPETRQTFQELWIDLAKVAYTNGCPDKAHSYLSCAQQSIPDNKDARLLIGELYLLNEKYEHAQPFLHELRVACAGNPRKLAKIGNAYWTQQQFPESLETYKESIQSYRNHPHLENEDRESVACILFRIGSIYAGKDNTIEGQDLNAAIDYFHLAHVNHPQSIEYQEAFFQINVRIWDIGLIITFATSYHARLLDFLTNVKDFTISKRNQVFHFLLEASQAYFQKHLKKHAHEFLNGICTLYDDNIEMLTQVLDLAIRFQEWKPYESKFAVWEKNYDNHPHLKASIGDAYASVSAKKAIDYYKQARKQFTSWRTLYSSETEREKCSQRIAELNLKIGNLQMNMDTGLFAQAPVAEALENLEKANVLHPSKDNAHLLFQSYLSAAQKEKEKNWITRDEDKILTYYIKAFQCQPTNGSYLVELMHLLLDKNRSEKAIQIYNDIQKQLWKHEFYLSHKDRYLLGEKLSEYGYLEDAIRCYKTAHQLRPRNKAYREQYLSTLLQFARNTTSHIHATKNTPLMHDQIGSLTKIAKQLDECWKYEFHEAESLRNNFQMELAMIYQTLGNHQLHVCMLPTSATLTHQERNQHQKQHQVTINLAIEYYDKGIEYHPKLASLHFNKGVILEWLVETEKALSSYELASQYQPQNIFYRKSINSLLSALGKNYDTHEHEEYIEKHSDHFPNLLADFLTWNRECMSKEKTKMIDPHSYNVSKKGWF